MLELDMERKNMLALFQKYIFKILRKLQYGHITIIDGMDQYDFHAKNPMVDCHVTVTVHDKTFYKEILIGGSNGAAESYIKAYWDTNDLEKLLEIIIKNKSALGDFDKGISRLTNFITNIANYFTSNNKHTAKQNILAHYDLGNDFFESFLDETMLYSSAVYSENANDLYHASLNKLKIICDLLQLNEKDHLLEIGAGWGGLAIYAAKHYGCKVTTTTISDKQYTYVKNKITQLGLGDKITLLNKDYRELTGCYDKIVSIEMIEAVGYRYFDAYFKKCGQLLKSGGLILLQAIVINDQSYEQSKNSVDFIKKFIFPGGCLPSIQAINHSVSQNTHFQLIYLNDIGKHYVRTLLDWLARFNKNMDLIKSLGYSEQFIRMWRYYLCYCAAGFNLAFISDVHCLWKNNKEN